MGNIITLILIGICMLTCLTISILQFNEKGFLFNNAYLYASKEERKKMDKKPHYRQSAIVFALLTAVFLCAGLEVLFETGWLLWIEGVVVAVTLIYAVVSSIKIARR